MPGPRDKGRSTRFLLRAASWVSLMYVTSRLVNAMCQQALKRIEEAKWSAANASVDATTNVSGEQSSMAESTPGVTVSTNAPAPGSMPTLEDGTPDLSSPEEAIRETGMTTKRLQFELNQPHYYDDCPAPRLCHAHCSEAQWRPQW